MDQPGQTPRPEEMELECKWVEKVKVRDSAVGRSKRQRRRGS